MGHGQRRVAHSLTSENESHTGAVNGNKSKTPSPLRCVEGVTAVLIAAAWLDGEWRRWRR
jgi:hypothetical protein